MPRRLIKRYLPSPHTIRQHRSLKPLRKLLQEPNLWHLNRRSVSVAAFVGIFICFIPLPIHMLTAAAGSIVLRCNVTLALALVWLSNPITMPPLFYLAYRLGTWILHTDIEPFTFELSFAWFAQSLSEIWLPLVVGCFAAGLLFGSLAYCMTQMAWRYAVICKWRQRQRARCS